MNSNELTTHIANTLNIARWEAASRVGFDIEELEIDPTNITPAQAAEIERCITADIKAGK